MGIGAYLGELKAKIVGERLSPDRVAAGWALGMFVGCSIPFGFQLIVSMPLAVLLKISKIGASVGTLITNPVSIIFIYPAQTMLMGWLLKRDFTWCAIKDATDGLIRNGDWHTLFALSGEIVTCFLLGGLLLAIILTPITYWIVRRIVVRHREQK